MEINNDPNLNAYHGLEQKIQNRKMSTAQNNNKPGDRLDLSGQKPADDKSDNEIRQDEIDRVRANIAAGHYEDPKVISKIVNRLIDQFGL